MQPLPFQVTYETAGFLEKNRDTLRSDVSNLLKKSKNAIVCSLFYTPLSRTGSLSAGDSHVHPSATPLFGRRAPFVSAACINSSTSTNSFVLGILGRIHYNGGWDGATFASSFSSRPLTGNLISLCLLQALHASVTSCACVCYKLCLHPLQALPVSVTSCACICYKLCLSLLQALPASVTSSACICYKLCLHLLQALPASVTSSAYICYKLYLSLL